MLCPSLPSCPQHAGQKQQLLNCWTSAAALPRPGAVSKPPRSHGLWSSSRGTAGGVTWAVPCLGRQMSTPPGWGLSCFCHLQGQRRLRLHPPPLHCWASVAQSRGDSLGQDGRGKDGLTPGDHGHRVQSPGSPGAGSSSAVSPAAGRTHSSLRVGLRLGSRAPGGPASGFRSASRALSDSSCPLPLFLRWGLCSAGPRGRRKPWTTS